MEHLAHVAAGREVLGHLQQGVVQTYCADRVYEVGVSVVERPFG
jgi:hypothetical protein